MLYFLLLYFRLQEFSLCYKIFITVCRYLIITISVCIINTHKEDERMINKLVDKIKKTNAPIVVGLDPMLSYVPEHITKKAFDELGETPAGAAEAIWQYNKAIVDATYDLIPAVKPQIAMYEQFGVDGLKAFQKTVDYCHEKDLVVIGDVKRGDIGSTSAAYATGHLGKVQIGSKSYSTFDEDLPLSIHTLEQTVSSHS